MMTCLFSLASGRGPVRLHERAATPIQLAIIMSKTFVITGSNGFIAAHSALHPHTRLIPMAHRAMCVRRSRALTHQSARATTSLRAQ